MSDVYVVMRTTDANGFPEYEPISVFSTAEAADMEAQVLGKIYNVEVHELVLNLRTLIPQGEVSFGGSE